MRARPAGLLCLFLLGACAPAATDESQLIAGGALKVEGAYAKQPVPGTDKSVGYVRLTNLGDASVQLTGVTMTGVRAVEMHTTRNDDGVMRMRRLDERYADTDQVGFVGFMRLDGDLIATGSIKHLVQV